ncbi:MAG: hypothetical protein Q8K63_02000 [Acidimicrobiales bacterium]|nr:hypothetical protein [Acidimicrobiales bacterium]
MAACGGNKDDEDDVAVGDTSTTQRDLDELAYVPAGNMYQSGIDERITFALFQGVPASLVAGDTEVMVAFQKPGTKVLTEAVRAERKSEGITDRPYYLVRHNFDAPGDWGVRATVKGKKPGDAVITINDPATAAWATPGDALPKVKTPTLADPLGVNPICTRSEGVCPWHDQSLDTLLGNGKPTIVLLATPAWCQSSTCGPVLDILLAERDRIGTKANIVHVEVFKDTTGKTLSPAFAEFKVTSEPVLLFADRNGIVTERFNGPYDASEAREAVTRLLA